MNQYPWWKNLLIVIVVAIGTLYALPNLYGEDPALQISSTRGADITDITLGDVRSELQRQGIKPLTIDLERQGLVVRFANTEDQLKARDQLGLFMQDDYVIALNLAPATPDWLRSFNALPMYLGLDLRGGVHFLMQVDTDAAVQMAEDRYVGDLRALLRENKVRYLTVSRISEGGVDIKFRNAEAQQKAMSVIRKEFRNLKLSDEQRGSAFYVMVRLSEDEIRETRKFAVQQNVTTLRNRVNELGVAEPLIQRQGEDRIVVQLPGVQDTARAKEILGATATLEFRMADETGNLQDALAGRVPAGSRLYKTREGGHVLLKKQVIVTGDAITDARSGIDSQNGSPNVRISLDQKGGKKMLKVTKNNVGKGMAVVFIELKTKSKMVDGKLVKTRTKVEEVINVANIREPFGSGFQITGLNSSEESRTLSLLLRAGALSAPIEIMEERTIGPSLGQDNIDMGFKSVVIGFVLVLIFMAVYYKVFGLVANLALAFNLVMVVAVLSMFQATLTLPGIAGIVLTVGMAVDANVLIFERIREELRNGVSPQAAIHAGYEKAVSTIADANITTLIAAFVLLGLGTGPIKGFAVTLAIGILTSMFTAIVGTRAVINVIYGGKRVKKLSI
ncbi:MAG TPA: protein translocase subunit SecD [Candidatus Tenderia electrophaga]|uniref:Protein translocase subunit SecD n=1 Tax=Candidatus Tenderia electrophaga TaxID=1748243 RepID=A0A832J770_9GAMM|nr:protein translocase subunit SecD [Candidatus Tenderia electrophaga]